MEVPGKVWIRIFDINFGEGHERKGLIGRKGFSLPKIPPQKGVYKVGPTSFLGRKYYLDEGLQFFKGGEV